LGLLPHADDLHVRRRGHRVRVRHRLVGYPAHAAQVWPGARNLLRTASGLRLGGRYLSWNEGAVVSLFHDTLCAIRGRSAAASMPPTVTEEADHHSLIPSR